MYLFSLLLKLNSEFNFFERLLSQKLSAFF